MLQFIPFDDRWFDAEELPPGPLVPYHAGMACAHPASRIGEDQCTAGGTLTKVAVSPSCTPNFAAAPAFNSRT